jgi:chemotaxis signal transduction protein
VTNPMSGFLLVLVDGRRIGLQLGQVLEVVQLGDVHPVPVRESAVRGLISVHGRMLPLVHLGALLDGRRCPVGPAIMGVVVTLGGRRVCLEVDDAEVLVHEPGLPVPPGEALPWATGVARYEDGLVPLLDLLALSSRLTEAAAT